jgi:hypothetical protein
LNHVNLEVIVKAGFLDIHRFSSLPSKNMADDPAASSRIVGQTTCKAETYRAAARRCGVT